MDRTYSLDEVVQRAAAETGSVPVDFGAARDDDFGPVAPGTYEAVIEECRPSTSKAGNPTVVFRFRLVEDGVNGRVLFRHCPTSGNGAGILRSTLRGLGFDVDSMTSFNPAEAEGIECRLDVGIQKNNPEFNEVKRVTLDGTYII